MPYDALTPEQKESVQALSAVVRPLAGDFARLLEEFQAVVAYYVGNVETILADLDAGDAIPNETDLAGAQSLTKTQFANLVGYMISASATVDGAAGSYNTNYHRALYAAACGPENMIEG